MEFSRLWINRPVTHGCAAFDQCDGSVAAGKGDAIAGAAGTVVVGRPDGSFVQDLGSFRRLIIGDHNAGGSAPVDGCGMDRSGKGNERGSGDRKGKAVFEEGFHTPMKMAEIPCGVMSDKHPTARARSRRGRVGHGAWRSVGVLPPSRSHERAYDLRPKCFMTASVRLWTWSFL